MDARLGIPAERLAWAAFEFPGAVFEVFGSVNGQVAAFAEVLAQQAVSPSPGLRSICAFPGPFPRQSVHVYQLPRQFFPRLTPALRSRKNSSLPGVQHDGHPVRELEAFQTRSRAGSL